MVDNRSMMPLELYRQAQNNNFVEMCCMLSDRYDEDHWMSASVNPM